MKLRTHMDGAELLLVAGIVTCSLKIAGVVGWSWWLVTTPFWVLPIAAFVVSFGMGVCCIGGMAFIVLWDCYSNRNSGKSSLLKAMK